MVMKDYSAAQIKKGFKTPLNQYPKLGSKVRELFDIFQEYKGHIVYFGEMSDKKNRWMYSRVRYLETFYGMDFTHAGPFKWQYIGEYISGKYVSYEYKKPLLIKLKRVL